MTKTLTAAALALAIALPTAAHAGGHGKHNMAGPMLQPMPNLMRVVMMHGDALNLTEAQSAALAEWRANSHPEVSGQIARIQTLRAELQEAVMNGADADTVAGYRGRIDAARDDIVARKLACRDNMQKVLSEEQFNTLTSLYRKHFM